MLRVLRFAHPSFREWKRKCKPLLCIGAKGFYIGIMAKNMETTVVQGYRGYIRDGIAI